MISRERPSVLLLAFVRVESLKMHVERLIDCGFEAVYVSIDGPRPGRSDDLSQQEEATRYLESKQSQITIHLNRFTSNFGPGEAVRRAIDWFFCLTHSGIILEDDCQPSPAFFLYCDLMLRRFRTDSDIAFISGCNLNLPTSGTLMLTNLPITWGWATWADRWRGFNNYIGDITGSVRFRVTRRAGFSYLQTISFCLQFTLAEQKKLDAWDLQWCLYNWRLRRYSIRPPSNLITYTGVDQFATHTSFNVQLKSIVASDPDVRSWNLSPLPVDRSADRRAANYLHRASSFRRVVRMLISVLVDNDTFFKVRSKFR